MKHRPLKRHFAFLYPDDKVLRELLDLAIFVLNPAEKLSAHITVAGPFEDSKDLPQQTVFLRKVCVFGVGSFKSETQNTVTLKVDARDLDAIWDKPDFPYNPHLTLYDGNDQELADRLYEVLFQERLYFCFFVSKVVHVTLIKGQGSWELMSGVNFTLLPELRGQSLSDIKNFTTEQRILVAVEALKRAKYRCLRQGNLGTTEFTRASA
jgi:hypothetical protein